MTFNFNFECTSILILIWSFDFYLYFYLLAYFWTYCFCLLDPLGPLHGSPDHFHPFVKPKRPSHEPQLHKLTTEPFSPFFHLSHQVASQAYQHCLAQN